MRFEFKFVMKLYLSWDNIVFSTDTFGGLRGIGSCPIFFLLGQIFF